MKSNKNFKILVVFLIIIISVIITYILCNKLETKSLEKEKNFIKEESNRDYFYNVENLLNKEYIYKIQDTEVKATQYSDSEPYVIQIKDNKVYITNIIDHSTENIKKWELVPAEGINGTPISVKFSEFSSGLNTTYMFIVLTKEGDLYRSVTVTKIDENGNKNNNINREFTKINKEKIVNIYNYSTGYDSKQCISYSVEYQNTRFDNVDRNYDEEYYIIYAENESGTLYRVSYQGGLSTTYKEDFPYIGEVGDNGAVLLIAPTGNLYYPKYSDKDEKYAKEEVKYKNNSLIIKDGFQDSNIDINIIDISNNLYKIKMKNKSFSVEKYKKVKEYNFKETAESSIATLKYEDGTTENFDVLNFSSLSYKNNKVQIKENYLELDPCYHKN